MNKTIDLAQTVTVSDVATLKIISDPLRLKILELIRVANQNGELRTIKQLAQPLDMTQPKLYYHIKQLEKHDLIRVADTKIVSGIVEKHYQVCAQTLRIDPVIFTLKTAVSEQASTLLNILQANLDTTYTDVLAFLTAKTDTALSTRLKGHRLHVSHKFAKINPDQVEAFHLRLQALVAEFESMTIPAATDEAYVYGLTTVLHPTLRTDAASLDADFSDDT